MSNIRGQEGKRELPLRLWTLQTRQEQRYHKFDKVKQSNNITWCCKVEFRVADETLQCTEALIWKGWGQRILVTRDTKIQPNTWAICTCCQCDNGSCSILCVILEEHGLYWTWNRPKIPHNSIHSIHNVSQMALGLQKHSAWQVKHIEYSSNKGSRMKLQGIMCFWSGQKRLV